jgi:hypothetical protein
MLAHEWQRGLTADALLPMQTGMHRLLTTGSIEEKVFQRQLAKQGLSEALVDDAGGDNRHFNREDLRDLFRVATSACWRG